MFRRIAYFSCLLVAILAVACSKPAEKRLSKQERRTLENRFVALRDTLDGRWKAMMASDDEKLFYTQRLLQELSYIPRMDVLKIKQLQASNDKLKARRYAQQTMSSDSIDAYDNAQNLVLAQVLELAGQNPDPDKYHLVGELAQEVQAHDDRVVSYRIDYDKAARAYNAWLAQYAPEVSKAASAKPVPMFSLPQ